MKKLKLGVLISGRGSNLQALIDAGASEEFPAEIILVISNRADAKGLGLAEQAGIATKVINHKNFGRRNAFDDALSRSLADAGVELICLAGFMLILQDDFISRWRDRIINIHPSLLPAFPGLNVHEKVIESGVRISGCTVHYVRPAVDNGPIIAQAAVPVLPSDTPESLADRVLKAEHLIYPMAVAAIGRGQITLKDEVVTYRDSDGAGSPLINPLLNV